MTKPITERLREQAEANVLAVRKSYDAPGFEACVNAEIERLKTTEGYMTFEEWLSEKKDDSIQSREEFYSGEEVMFMRMGWQARDAEIAELRGALADMLSGWKYIRQNHGDLYGVGWDRAQNKAEQALKGKQDDKR